MILDKLENKDLYVKAHPLFEKAFGFVEEYLKNPVEPGEYHLCGDDLFARVMVYDTRADGQFEVHNKYIDIQYIAEGAERVAYGRREDFASAEYDAEGDFMFLEGDDQKLEFILSKGEFVVFFPEDAHKPSLDVETTGKVTKVVLKVKAEVE